MDAFVEELYLRELVLECEHGFGALSRLNALLASQQYEATQVFRELTDFLQHAAAASRLLWSPEKKDRARRRCGHLRKSLGVPFEHPMRYRQLRNHLEHYDDRLDQWVEDSPRHYFQSDNLGPLPAYAGATDREILRHYDPSSKTFVFRGERFDIQALADAMSDVHARAAKRLKEL